MTSVRNFSSRRGEINQNLLVVGGIVACAVVGIIIAYAVHHHRNEVARGKSQAHIVACKQLREQIDQAKSPLAGAGLSFQVYQSRFDSAAASQKHAEESLARDPQQADKISEGAEREFKSLLSDLQLAVQVHDDHSGSEALQSAEAHIAQVRATKVSFSYPGSSSAGSVQNYRLDEAGQNPDTHIAECRRLLSGIEAVLQSGQPQEARRILTNARSEATAAENCIQLSLDSKKAVESQIAAINSESEPSDASYSAAVEKAYFNQEFVAASTRMNALKKRIDDRRETRELLAYCQRQSVDVGQTLQENSAYSSYATDQKFQTLSAQLANLAGAVTENDADWASLKSTGQYLQAGFNQVRDEAVQAHRDYDDAVLAVRTFRRDYDQADRNAAPPLSLWSQAAAGGELSNPVKEKVAQVNDLLGRVEPQIKQSKQDWRQIKLDAETGSRMLADLRVMFEEDNQNLARLSQLRNDLKQVTDSNRYSCTINGKTFNAGEVNRRDRAFVEHWTSATNNYDVAMRAWHGRERIGFDDAARNCRQEIVTVNNLGWYNMLHMLRTSSDPVAQNAAWDNGYRDNKSFAEWVDGFVSRRATNSQGFWVPDTRSTSGGGADFGPAPDFNASLPN